MKFFIDGDQLVIVKGDFIDLQESPALFYPLGSDIAKTVLETGSIESIEVLPMGDLRHIHSLPKIYQWPKGFSTDEIGLMAVVIFTLIIMTLIAINFGTRL